MPKPRTPNRLKVLRGTDQPSRMGAEADYPPVSSTEPPDWLINAEAEREWHTRIGHLTAAGVLTDADLTALAYYCNDHARAVMKWDAGSEPTAADKTQLRMMLGEFGFTPASRSKPAKAGSGESANKFTKHGKRGA